MITITVKALTENAIKGITRHFKECNKIRNRITLNAHGVTQTLNKDVLTISYSNLLTKIQNKMKQDFKAILKEDQKEDFIKHVDGFMFKQLVEKEEYEVLFDDSTN